MKFKLVIYDSGNQRIKEIFVEDIKEITSYHVIYEESEVVIHLHDGTEIKFRNARMIAY